MKRMVRWVMLVTIGFRFTAVAQEQTQTGFFYPRSSNLGTYAGYLDSGCGSENKYFSGMIHLGKDSWANLGDPVYAVADGEVVWRSVHGWIYGDMSGTQAGDGITTNIGLLIKHQTSQGLWFEAVYGHILSRLQVGDKVYAGRQIGTVGPYGGQEHVHFGVRIPLTSNASDYPASHYGRAYCYEWPLGTEDRWIDPIQFITARAPENYLGAPPSGGGGPPSGGGGAATILGITPLSTPVPGQRFVAQVHALNLQPVANAVVTGPGCPTMTSCVVPSGVITFMGDLANVPLTLGAGSFTIYLQQSGQLSNGWPLSVAGGGGGTPSAGNLNINFSPNPVSRASDGAWYYTVTVSETSGTAVTLTGMTIGGQDYSGQISNWFGTNTVPAHGHVSVGIKTTGSAGSMVWQFTSGTMSWSAPVNMQ
ncbi:MAG TPA: peptidoglycan DD-metalloendopeptidase family protein [Gemmataceae bacterium]|nr:peptidoglycan DD-metalloendopeptidase family protein [Gemmataceae bacterium]